MNQGEDSDLETVQKVQAGDTDAFEVLIKHHDKMVFNLLYRMLGDYEDASEVAQEVFLSAFRSIRRFRAESSFSTWLYRIAVNQAKNRLKAASDLKRRTIPLEIADPDRDGRPISGIFYPGLDPAQEAEEQEIHDRVHRELNRLDKDDRVLILLRDLQDVPYEEMTKILGVPLGTVKSRLHRARQALKTRLAPYFYSTKVRK
jgi:RNA polymerase sigma-70 factor (ECF subfamily)